MSVFVGICFIVLFEFFKYMYKTYMYYRWYFN